MHNIFQEGSFFTLLIGSIGIKINNWNMDDNPVRMVIVFLNALTKKAIVCGVLHEKGRSEKAFLVSVCVL